jgi:uncharacterized membrane protein YkvA (DUF1232 family)
MMKRLRFLKRAAIDLPRQARLGYCLMRDGRVPTRIKLAFGAGIAVIVTPFIDLPGAIPVVGELDMLALSLLALRLFIAACPDDVVVDVEQQILEGRSVFDEDLRNGERVATFIARRFEHHGTTVDQEVRDSEPVPPPAKQSGVGA